MDRANVIKLEIIPYTEWKTGEVTTKGSFAKESYEEYQKLIRMPKDNMLSEFRGLDPEFVVRKVNPVDRVWVLNPSHLSEDVVDKGSEGIKLTVSTGYSFYNVKWNKPNGKIECSISDLLGCIGAEKCKFLTKKNINKLIDTIYDTAYNISRRYNECQNGIN